MKKIKKANKKNLISFFIITLVVLVLVSLYAVININEKNNNRQQTPTKVNVADYYNEYVITNKNSSIYKKEESKFIEIGKINQKIELKLDGYTNEYFKISNLDEEYYIKYTDVDKIDSLSELNKRYEKYIVWNKNVITNDTTNFYGDSDEIVYSINKSFELPIIINDESNQKYYVEYAEQLLYIKGENIKEIRESNNTNAKNTEGIAVLNYHFIYNEESKNECNQSLCVSEEQFGQHLNYIKENNYFTPTMKELEMYMDSKIQLPKSVVITADDGWLGGNYKKMLDNYQLNGTIFLITSSYDPSGFKSEYVEVHSHGDDIHNVGVCSGGQGGGIKCLPKNELLKDLENSRNKLNGSTVFCYPFYEYNDYSIEVLKEVGFTMAFAGERDGGDIVARPGGNKYEIPRWVIVDYTTMNNLKTYLELGIA